ncbi:MAG TPA: methyl-accepting chemotaxis protein [Actinomycetes bacterium]|nr:methyl-accepting chemotaxis protein [Actinomycetes bacterium]
MQRRFVRAIALMLGLTLVAAGSVLWWQASRETAAREQILDQNLSSSADSSAVLLAEHFERAVAADIQLASQPAFIRFYKLHGSVDSKIKRDLPVLHRVEQGLASIETIFPGAVSEACFINVRDGQEIARIVDGKPAPTSDLSPDESKAPFFAPTADQVPGVPYQSQPYVSPDSGLWVIGTATVIARHGIQLGIVHFETSIESLRASALSSTSAVQLRVIDPSGKVVMDEATPQVEGAELGTPDVSTFEGTSAATSTNHVDSIGDERVALAPLPAGQTLSADNANTWVVAASAPVIATGALANLSPLILALLALGIPLLLAALVAYWLARKRQRIHQEQVQRDRDVLDEGMSELSDALTSAAAGDLYVTFSVDLGDERMTALAKGFDATLTHLRGLVSQAQLSGMRLTASAAQLRASATQQAQSAEEQATAVTETTATVEELAATAAQIADTASDVADSAQQTLALTEEGIAAVRDSVAAMDRITDKVSSIATSSTSLGEKVNEIGHILTLIDELSEQTNLLALNAAIEAARAGEHGRGFAVVAAEVRKLAERAQQSTAQIQGLVTEIKSHTQSTVLASEDGAREAGHGVQVAGSAVSALDRIADMVDNTTTAVAEISVATQQQRSASDQVVVAMAQVADVSSQFAAGSQQSAASAQEITALADEFEASVSSFSDGPAKPHSLEKPTAESPRHDSDAFPR